MITEYEKFADGFVYYKNIIKDPKGIINQLESLSEDIKKEMNLNGYNHGHASWNPWTYQKDGNDLFFCNQLWLDNPENLDQNDKFYQLKSELYTSLSENIKDAYDHFSQTLYPYASRNIKGQVDAISVLKYEKSGFLPEHIDQGISSRVLSVLVYLNDDYDGGEITFANIGENGITIKPEAGSVIFFPSNFVGVHSVAEITSGIRYALPNWYHNRIDKKESDGSE
jgi:Rps23 Pro-64 3,4-dihydroxylase Tpa1-like proline 4-hydroxylase